MAFSLPVTFGRRVPRIYVERERGYCSHPSTNLPESLPWVVCSETRIQHNLLVSYMPLARFRRAPGFGLVLQPAARGQLAFFSHNYFGDDWCNRSNAFGIGSASSLGSMQPRPVRAAVS